MKMTKTTAYTLGILLLAGTQTALSETYRGEVGIDYSDSDVEDDPNIFGLNFQWYFKPVVHHSKKRFRKEVTRPLAEAGFLGKNSNIVIQYTQSSLDELDGVTGADIGLPDVNLAAYNTGSIDTMDTVGRLNYFVPESIFFVGLEYRSSIVKITDDDEFSDTNWAVTGGIMPVENLLVTTTYVNDIDFDLNFKAKYVVELERNTAINFEMEYEKLEDPVQEMGNNGTTEDEDIFNISADYYFNKTFSIGTGLVDADDTGYELRTRKFINETVSVQARFRTFEEEKTYQIGISARL